MKHTAMIKELPEDERPREKLMKHGSTYLSNAELLAILLVSGTKERSATMLADQLLALDPGGISSLAQSLPQELSKVPGVGIAKACQITAAIELGKRIAAKPREKRLNVNSPKEVAGLFMEGMRCLKREYFKVLMLNTKNEIIHIEETSIGNLNSAIVHPREVFSGAIRRCASSVILVHNHPSGNPQPSQQDVDLTARLVQAGELLGITVLDHLIIGDGIFLSLKEKNMM